MKGKEEQHQTEKRRRKAVIGRPSLILNMRFEEDKEMLKYAEMLDQIVSEMMT
jgi:hypothetical protein